MVGVEKNRYIYRSMIRHVPFDYAYRWWVYFQSVVFLTAFVLATPFFPVSPSVSALLMAGWGGAMMLLLLVYGLVTATGAAMRAVHLLTAVRTVAAVSLFLFSAVHGGRVGGVETLGIGAFLLPPGLAWTVFGALLVVEATDLLDGRLARRLVRERGEGASRSESAAFGPAWDMENDAFFVLALSFVAWQLVGIPVVVLLIGAMRYFYFILVRAEGDPPGENPAYKFFAKSTAATLAVVLIVIYVPVLPHALRGAFVYGALGLQVISFSWDLVLRARAGLLGRSAGGLLSGRRRS